MRQVWCTLAWLLADILVAYDIEHQASDAHCLSEHIILLVLQDRLVLAPVGSQLRLQDLLPTVRADEADRKLIQGPIGS